MAVILDDVGIAVPGYTSQVFGTSFRWLHSNGPDGNPQFTLESRA